ncbi:hypothetical protein [Kineosporia sp. NBRC 101731]|nr:hypothetical protein [Kineosporia sp. NBRC 101731]
MDGALDKLEQIRADVTTWEQVARSADVPERVSVRTPGASNSDE